MRRSVCVVAIIIAICTLTSCNTQKTAVPPDSTAVPSSANVGGVTPSAALTQTFTPEAQPPRVLRICTQQEPNSLFLYGDRSQAANDIRQAIYDGPLDVRGYTLYPVILERIPSLKNGDTRFEAQEVKPGDLIVDVNGQLLPLGEGVVYLPVGCQELGCASTYSGEEPVTVDQLVVIFKLLPGIQWSDGAPLTADDSQYSYEVAKSLTANAPPDEVFYAQSYQALNELSIEWRAVPGYQGARYEGLFFSPLPRHIWGDTSPGELLNAEMSSKRPLGWGPYVIDQWLVGESITLSRNTNYFRAGSGLPTFDQLVFQFVQDSDQALTAIQNGECDLLTATAFRAEQRTRIGELQDEGTIKVHPQHGTSWEHIVLGINSLAEERPDWFGSLETRQAVAMCLDRQAILNDLSVEQEQMLDTYVPNEHPLHNPQVVIHSYDPGTASRLLESAGWVDHDQDPATPRTALNVAGVPDGTTFQVSYMVPEGDERQRMAQIVGESLASCGIQVIIDAQPWESMLAPGPEGAVFGRQFDMAQYAWEGSLEPPCSLFVGDQIPGPYPEHPYSWGGANSSGYSSQDFDLSCQLAEILLPDSVGHQSAHLDAQRILSEELPFIPLFAHSMYVITSKEICGVVVGAGPGSALWNLEAFGYVNECNYQGF